MQKIRRASFVVGAFAIGLMAGCTGPGSGPANSAPLSHASSIAVDATDAYWVSSVTTIQRQSKSGGAVSVFVTEPCGGVGAVAVDDGYVYWSHGYTSTSCTASVSRMPKGGGPVEVLATGLIFEGEGGIVLDDQAVYVVATALTASELMSVPSGLEHARSTVYSVAKSGGTPIPVAGPNVSGDPAVDGQGGVYSLSVPGDQPASPATTSIMRTDSEGTTKSLATVNGNVARLAFFGNRIYWVVSGYHLNNICMECDTPTIVQSMGPGDLAPVTVVTLAAGSLIHDAIVDPGGLWLDLEGTRSGLDFEGIPRIDDHTGVLLHVPSGGSPAAVLTDLPSSSDLTADDTTVFATGDTAPLLVAK